MSEARLAGPERAACVRRLFDAVARRYDLLNHLLSAGLDRRWRRRAADVLAEGLAEGLAGGAAALQPRLDKPAVPHIKHALASGSRLNDNASPPRPSTLDPHLILDLCSGTGDLAVAALARLPAARVIACDFSRPMLERAAAKFARLGLAGRAAVLEADALALPLPDASADGVTCAFGLRNLADPRRGLAEMVRVVRPGGPVVILEFYRPAGRGLRARLFGLYFRRILPRLGGWISGGGHGGYAYLVDSIDAFGPIEGVAAMLAQAGLRDVRAEPLPGGVAAIFRGLRPD